MLKFHDNNTTPIATFEDFILTAYVIIDELYRRFAPPEVAARRHVLDARLSDPEIITISICGELAGIDSENAWYSFIKRNYHHLFPTLCSRSRFSEQRAKGVCLHIHLATAATTTVMEDNCLWRIKK